MPGGSRTILAASGRCSAKSLYELMGSELERHVSDEAALAMAGGCLAPPRSADRGTDCHPLSAIPCLDALASCHTLRRQHRIRSALIAQEPDTWPLTTTAHSSRSSNGHG